MLDIQSPEVHFAIEAVRQAAQTITVIQKEMITANLVKEDRSPVTVADFTSQALIARHLHQAFPDDPLVAEEDSRALKQPQSLPILEKVLYFMQQREPHITPEAVFQWIDYGQGSPQGRYWTLDPIDGTKGFLRGDQFAIALALVIHHQVQIGVLGCPKLNPQAISDPDHGGAIFIAVRGQGTWSTTLDNPSHFERLSVSNRTDPTQALLLRSFESSHTNTDQIEEFAKQIGIIKPPLRMDSQAKYALLATGQGDLLMRLLNPAQPDYRERIWDQAAGSLIIEEAGGQITDISGKPLQFHESRFLSHNQGILATNRYLHPIALRTLSAIGAVPQ